MRHQYQFGDLEDALRAIGVLASYRDVPIGLVMDYLEEEAISRVEGDTLIVTYTPLTIQ